MNKCIERKGEEREFDGFPRSSSFRLTRTFLFYYILSLSLSLSQSPTSDDSQQASPSSPLRITTVTTQQTSFHTTPPEAFRPRQGKKEKKMKSYRVHDRRNRLYACQRWLGGGFLSISLILLILPILFFHKPLPINLSRKHTHTGTKTKSRLLHQSTLQAYIHTYMVSSG